MSSSAMTGVRPPAWPGKTWLAPDERCGSGDGCELRPLVVAAERVAEDRGAEAALRREREPLERHDARRILDARRQLVRRLLPGRLRRDEPEHDDLVLGHEPQRLEAAGALVVVLEQQPVRLD